MPGRLTTTEFIEKSISIHGNMYEYSRVDYKNNIIVVQIECLLHGFFNQAPRDHLRGCGCPTCGLGKISDKKSITEEKFLRLAEEKFERKFNYSYINYIDYETNITIVCSKHGPFIQSPRLHLLTKYGCPE